MPKAGLFAGEVTPQAPADGAITTKFKGYQWMEYGNVAPSGICGDIADLEQGQLLNVSPLSIVGGLGASISESNARLNGVSFQDSKEFGFTCAFVRQSEPQAGNDIGAFSFEAGATAYFAFYMDSNGYMNIVGRNDAGTIVLDVLITNNGSSFADSTIHMIAVAIDMSDSARREIYLNNTNITGNPSYCIWNTYTDDLIHFEDSVSTPLQYNFGFGLDGGWGYTSVAGGSQGPTAKTDSLGYISFDDSCSLLPVSVWDDQGYVRDPGAWEGWYLVQPEVFFGPSFWKNSGTTAPRYYNENNMEKAWEVTGAVDLYLAPTGDVVIDSPIDDAVVNVGIGSKTEAT